MRFLKIGGSIFAAVIGILLIGCLVINYGPVQEEIVHFATEELSKKLDTKVEIESARVNFFNQSVNVCGLNVEDQQHRDLLKVEEAWVSLRMLPLFLKRIELKEGKLKGVYANIQKPSKEEPANYQFILDAFKKKKKNDKDDNDEDAKDDDKDKQEKKKSPFSFNLSHATLEDINVRYNDTEVHLDNGKYTHWRDEHELNLEHAQTTLKSKTKKGPVDNYIDCGILTIHLNETGEGQLTIEGLKFKTDNHLPRKNTGKPHRGAFDAGHLDFTADLNIDILHLSKDSLNATLKSCCATDSVTGFDFKDIKLNLAANKKTAQITNWHILQGSTQITIPKVDVIIPNKKDSIGLYYQADEVTAKVILKDIAQPFAPVLEHFTIPLNLYTRVSGNDNGMVYRGIRINTDDKKFALAATGILRDMKEKEKLNLHFDVQDMVAKSGIAHKIVNQFQIKKFMMRQLYTLGLIKYHGSFDILWKKEIFRGKLNTDMGLINFNFQLDEKEKYVTGSASTDSLQLGRLFDLKQFKEIACSADFSFDFNKKRTAEIRKEKGGKLPIGNVKAQVDKVGYRSIHLKNILANIESDGALAEGDVVLKGNLTDLVLKFSFENTEQMHKMKIKPGLKFRDLTKGK